MEVVFDMIQNGSSIPPNTAIDPENTVSTSPPNISILGLIPDSQYNMEIYKILLTIQASLPTNMNLLLHDNIGFEDALGRNMSLPYAWFRHWDVCHSTISL